MLSMIGKLHIGCIFQLWTYVAASLSGLLPSKCVFLFVMFSYSPIQAFTGATNCNYIRLVYAYVTLCEWIYHSPGWHDLFSTCTGWSLFHQYLNLFASVNFVGVICYWEINWIPTRGLCEMNGISGACKKKWITPGNNDAICLWKIEKGGKKKDSDGLD